MRRSGRYTLGAAIALAAAVAVGQEPSQAAVQSGPAAQYGFELGLGTTTLLEDPTEPQDERTNPMKVYQHLAFRPDLSFGKFGVGLDLSVNFNLDLGSGGEGVKIYQPDWIPQKAGKNFLELYLPKIAYLRYGQKGEPLFAKLGSFDDGTLGNGFIMGDYANTRFLPGTRIFGASLDVDGSLFNFPYLGVETFVGNVAILDVLGSRVYSRPFASLELPLLPALQVGATVAADREPQYYDEDRHNDRDGDAVVIPGIDFRQPLVEKEIATVAVFGDAAFQRGGRWGTALGAGGTLIRYLPYTAQLRLMGPGFIPTYFDGAYDLFRAVKYAQLQEDPSGDVFVGWLAGLGYSLAGVVTFRVTADGPFKSPERDSVTLSDYPHLRATLNLAEGILGGFSLGALYEKYLLGAPESAGGTGNFWRDLVDPENAVIAATVSYRTGPALISLIHNLRYDPATGDFTVATSLTASVRF